MKRVLHGLLLALTIMGADVGADRIALSKSVFDKAASQYGESARYVLLEWEKLLNQTRSSTTLTELQKMEIVNNFFNQVKWVSDREHWGREDYWATPVETLSSNGGDCEDFSIGKYFSLKAVGIDTKKLRITYVKSLTYNQAHMVLAYYPSPEAEPLILDNINKQILPASKQTDLIPIYSFNADDLWLAKSRGQQLKVGDPSNLKSWIGVSQRMSQELSLNSSP